MFYYGTILKPVLEYLVLEPVLEYRVLSQNKYSLRVLIKSTRVQYSSTSTRVPCTFPTLVLIVASLLFVLYREALVVERLRRLPRMQEVVGSNPTEGKIWFSQFTLFYRVECEKLFCKTNLKLKVFKLIKPKFNAKPWHKIEYINLMLYLILIIEITFNYVNYFIKLIKIS